MTWGDLAPSTREVILSFNMAEGLSVAILVVSWTETAFGLVFLTLRFLSNWQFVGRFRWDFWLALLTVVRVSNSRLISLVGSVEY